MVESVICYFIIFYDPHKHSRKLEQTFSMFQYGTRVHFFQMTSSKDISLQQNVKICPQMYENESTESIKIKN